MTNDEDNLFWALNLVPVTCSSAHVATSTVGLKEATVLCAHPDNRL